MSNVSAIGERFSWRQGEASATVSYPEAAVGHGGTAYFSLGYKIYLYTVSEDMWTALEPCSCQNFGLAVLGNRITTIGGRHGVTTTKALQSLFGISSKMSWEELYPPMSTERIRPAVVTAQTHLVVAGGAMNVSFTLSTASVEVLNLHSLQWASASSSPKVLPCPNMTLCDEFLYLSRQNVVFSCSVEELVESSKTNNSGSVWTRLPDTPTYNTTLATLRGSVLAIGGSDKCVGGTPTGAIHCYDSSTNSWSVIGEMPTPRYGTLVADLPSNELVVAGGQSRGHYPSQCRVTEIASLC